VSEGKTVLRKVGTAERKEGRADYLRNFRATRAGYFELALVPACWQRQGVSNGAEYSVACDFGHGQSAGRLERKEGNEGWKEERYWKPKEGMRNAKKGIHQGLREGGREGGKEVSK
jgi:hypothetical protein